MVIDHGITCNPCYQYIRHYLLQKCRLVASIQLPPDTFTLTGTKTGNSILILQKLPHELNGKNYGVFMTMIEGLPFTNRGDLNYRRKKNRVMTEELHNDFERLPLFFRKTVSRHVSNFVFSHIFPS